MNTKQRVLKALEENRANYVSGQDLADKLNITRTSVWKAINSLKEEGFEIESLTKKGYKLVEDDDNLSVAGIRKGLRDELKDINIKVFDSIDSTNTEAKRMLYSEEVDNFTVLVANEQTGGRGRRGRNFSSPKGTGIYFSIIFHPEETFDISYFDLVTVRAAVSVAQGIEESTGVKSEIKWVNDIFVNKKKVCGILSELDADFETKTVKSIIVGCGINVNEPKGGFNEDLQNIAGFVGTNIIRNEILAKILNKFYHNYYEETEENILKYYKENSLVLGKNLTFIKNDEKFTGIGKDINEKGNLIVETENGIMTLSSGEVSVRGYLK
ncbi:biotin--[acetyl-CoA-carboxylase] ligase [Peptoniphilus sp.]|jgi:BirA family biotin operon repressor/biotin-[acetyl-CoA-carboxylase] ligase|uniref:biotin--[acetyl-CoA-carboxylase] ligase n=1 Tax=Peptoniphilus sp. TaxID=1971214 RepID=UPI003D9364C4